MVKNKIREVWKTYNVSYVMILPLFNTITKGVHYIHAPGTGFPFNQLCLEYGLIDTYLYEDNKKRFDGNLYVSFDREKANTNLKLTDSPYHSIVEMILDSEHFNGLIMKNDVIIFKLKIPDKHHKDIALIEQSLYSKVSYSYKMLLKIDQKRVPYDPENISELGSYITKHDLGYAISMKGVHIRDELQEFLDTFITSNEFYTKFDRTKEVLDYSKMLLLNND